MWEYYNPTASSYCITFLHRQFEHDKQRRYEQRVCEVEIGSSSLLVFRGMGGTATTLYKRITSLLSVKREQPYSLVILTHVWLWYTPLAFLCYAGYAIPCLRGASGSPSSDRSIWVTTTEGQVIPSHYFKHLCLVSYSSKLPSDAGGGGKGCSVVILRIKKMIATQLLKLSVRIGWWVPHLHAYKFLAGDKIQSSYSTNQTALSHHCTCIDILIPSR